LVLKVLLRKGDKDVKKEIKKTSGRSLIFRKKNHCEILKLNARSLTKLA
jgi:hypothetical protein